MTVWATSRQPRRSHDSEMPTDRSRNDSASNREGCGIGTSQQRRKRRRREAGVMLILFLLLIVPASAIDEPPDAATDDNRRRIDIEYEWEAYDLYQILGLADALSSQSTGILRGNGPGVTGRGGKAKVKSRRKRVAERNLVGSTDIRRAYMRQALLYHPDKVKSRTSSSTRADRSEKTASRIIDEEGRRRFDDSSESSGGHVAGAQISEEESAARFALICEAYEVLSDPVRRTDYDEYLLDIEDEASSKPPNFLQRASSDARCVFEEFFAPRDASREGAFDFAGASGDGEDDGSNGAGDPIELISYIEGFSRAGDGERNWHGGDSKPPPKGRPRKGSSIPPPDSVLVRTSELTQTSFEPRFNSDVTRVLRNETFATRSPDGSFGGTVYSRTVAQDFIEVESKCSGRTLGHIAVSRPFLLEGKTYGLTAHSASERAGGDRSAAGWQHGMQGASLHHKTQQRKRPRRQFDSILLPHETITLGDMPLVSPDGRYRASLSRECRIVITEMRRQDNDEADEDDEGTAANEEPTLKWSSKNAPPSRPDKCRLAMYGPQLILGDIEEESDVLWFTPPIIPGSAQGATAETEQGDDGGEQKVDDDDDAGSFYYYYAILDNDGRMGVYKHHSNGDHDEYRGDPSSAEPYYTGYTTNAVRLAWSSLRRLVDDATLLWSTASHADGRGNGSKVDECIYVTGSRNGCQTAGRQPVRANTQGGFSKGRRREGAWSWALIGMSVGIVQKAVIRPITGAVRSIVRAFFR